MIIDGDEGATAQTEKLIDDGVAPVRFSTSPSCPAWKSWASE